MIPLGTNKKDLEPAWRKERVTPKQRAKLQEFGVRDIEIDNMNKGEASDRLNRCFEEDRAERNDDRYWPIDDGHGDWN